MILVEMPAHLRQLAKVTGTIHLDVVGLATQTSVLDALEARYPMLRGTIRDHVTKRRRPFIRFFACEEDLSHNSPEDPLPDAVAEGREPFWIVGAIAGGLRDDIPVPYGSSPARDKSRLHAARPSSNARPDR